MTLGRVMEAHLLSMIGSGLLPEDGVTVVACAPSTIPVTDHALRDAIMQMIVEPVLDAHMAGQF